MKVSWQLTNCRYQYDKGSIFAWFCPSLLHPCLFFYYPFWDNTFWTQNMFKPKIYWNKKILNHKYFRTQLSRTKSSYRRKSWVSRFVWAWNISDPNFCGLKFVLPNIFGTQRLTQFNVDPNHFQIRPTVWWTWMEFDSCFSPICVVFTFSLVPHPKHEVNQRLRTLRTTNSLAGPQVAEDQTIFIALLLAWWNV